MDSDSLSHIIESINTEGQKGFRLDPVTVTYSVDSQLSLRTCYINCDAAGAIDCLDPYCSCPVTGCPMNMCSPRCCRKTCEALEESERRVKELRKRLRDKSTAK